MAPPQQQQHHLVFSDDVLYHMLLSFLNYQSMLQSGFLVCKQWNNIIRSIPIDLVLEKYQFIRLLNFSPILNIRSLELNQSISEDLVERIQNCQTLNTVQKLVLSSVVNYSSMIKIISSPMMKNLTDVRFCGSVDKKAKSIDPSPPMKNLKSLSLSGSVDDLLRSISRSEYFENLTELDVNLAHYSDEGICALMGNESHVKNLTSLNCESSQLTAKAIQTIANSSHMKNLTKLNIGYNYKGSDGIKDIARSEFMKNLKILHITTGVEHFTDPNSYVKNLIKIKIMGEQLNQNVIDIANCPHMNQLEKLGRYFGTSTSNLKESGDRALAESPHVTKLKKYYLEFDDGDEPSMFLSSSNCSHVKSIYGCINTIEMMKSITDSSHLKNLISLHIYGNVGDDAFQLLSYSENVKKLQSFSYRYSGEGELPTSRLIHHLITSQYLKLNKLKLSNINIGLEGMNQLVSSGLMRNLRKLTLEECNINENIMEELSKGENLQNLTSLSLSYNPEIGGSIYFLCKNPNFSNLKALNLSNCGLTDQDVLNLSRCKYLKTLRKLNFRSNMLSNESLKHLLLSEHLTKLATIDFFHNSELLIDQEMVDFVSNSVVRFTNLSFFSFSKKGKNSKKLGEILEGMGVC